MKKIKELQEKLLLEWQKEQQIYEEIQKKASQDHSKLKRCKKRMKEIHQQITQLVEIEKSEIQKQITNHLWQEPQLQNYIGIYQSSRNPYMIQDISPRDEKTIEIQAITTPSFDAKHRNVENGLIQNTIILKDTNNGLLCYNEQEFQDKRKRASLKMKDAQNHKYMFHIFETEEEKTIIKARIDYYRFGLYFVYQKNLDQKVSQQDLLDMGEQILTNTAPKPGCQKSYFKYIAEESNSIDLLNEIPKYRKKIK